MDPQQPVLFHIVQEYLRGNKAPAPAGANTSGPESGAAKTGGFPGLGASKPQPAKVEPAVQKGATAVANRMVVDVNQGKKSASSLSDGEDTNKEMKNLREAQSLIKRNETNLKSGKLGEIPSKAAEKNEPQAANKFGQKYTS